MLILSAAFTITGIAFIFGILIIVHEAGHFFAAKRAGVKVERFAIGFGKKIMGIRKGETEYAINIVPIGGYVKLAGEDPYERKGLKDEFYSKPVISRLGILVSGPAANYIFAFLILLILYTVGTPALTSDIGSVLKGTPAHEAGIKAGDKIVYIDGKDVKYWHEVLKIIRADKEGRPLDIKVDRDGEIFKVKVKPRVITTENIFKQKADFVGIGVGPGEKVIFLRSNPIKSFDLAARHVWFFTAATYKGIWLIVTGALPVRESVGGPVRIVEELTKAIKYGPLSVLNITATISLALAIFNLLPFPVLDGGHILFLGIEKLRGKPLSAKTQGTISHIAIFLLVAFFLYVTYHDTLRLFK